MVRGRKYSLGYNVDASGGAVTDEVVFTVPVGYHAVVHMFFVANTSVGSATISAKWFNDTTHTFLSAKNMSAGDYIQFGGDGLWLVMHEGDSFKVDVSSGSTATFLVSYTLERYPNG